MPSVRRLTAILAVDVAGYSRLMGADEEGTHVRVTAHFRELPLAEEPALLSEVAGGPFLHSGVALAGAAVICFLPRE
jgi:hypothetical protein